MRQFRNSELDFHLTAVRYALGIFHGFPCVGEKPFHFLLALDIILPAHIAHPVLIRQLFSGLDAQQDIVRLYILRVSVMDIVGNYQGNPKFFTHLHESRIYHPLLGQSMILHFQKIIVFPEAVPVF